MFSVLSGRSFVRNYCRQRQTQQGVKVLLLIYRKIFFLADCQSDYVQPKLTLLNCLQLCLQKTYIIWSLSAKRANSKTVKSACI